MQDAQQNALCLDKCNKVELWHPIHSSVEEIETWRRHLINLEIVQPFKHPQQLDQIPPLIFSEVMRDIDLFVAVASVGNDPAWEHRQEMAYWGEYNNEIFLASAETRKQVLAELLPKLKIAKQTRIEGRYLIVEGTLRT